MYSLSSELGRSRVQVYTDEFMAFPILSHSSVGLRPRKRSKDIPIFMRELKPLSYSIKKQYGL